MNFLLNTHALLWALSGSERLTRPTRDILTDPHNGVFVSAASAWEIAIKVGLGKLDILPDVASWLPGELATVRLTPLPITGAHALAVERLPPFHTDPFDRLLIAQANAEELTLVSCDRQIERFDVRLLRC